MKKDKKLKKPRPWWFGIIKGFLRIFIRKPKMVYLGDPIQEQGIILCNHVGAKGPLNLELHLNRPFRFWGTYEMNSNVREVYRYLSQIYFLEKKHFKPFFAKLIGFIGAPLAWTFYRGLNLISTYTDLRLKTTFKESLDTIKKGYSLVIFPEDSHDGYHDNLKKVFAGFAVFAKICYKQGVDLPIYISYLRKKKKTLIVDKPIRYSELAAKYKTNEEITDFICSHMNNLQYQIPEKQKKKRNKNLNKK